MLKKYVDPIELYVSVTDTTQELVNNIRCKILLPQNSIDKVSVTLFPNDDDQYDKICKSTRLAILGEQKQLDGTTTKKILISNAVIVGANKITKGLEFIEYTIDLHILDLLITDILANREESSLLHGRFWLSPSELLNPNQIREQSYTGAIKIEELSHTNIITNSGIKLDFTKNYKFYTVNEEQVSFSELVASFECEDDDFKINNLIDDVDIVLLLTSLAERKRIICIGWDTINSYQTLQFYRKNLAMDNLNTKEKNRDLLIDTFHFRKFLAFAYKKYLSISTSTEEFFRNALNMLLSKDERESIEKEFLTLFTALESLTAYNYLENYPDKEVILSEDIFKHFVSEIKCTIKDSKVLGSVNNPKETRSFMYSKLQELNRVPISKGIQLLCNHYNVSIDDLWPISGNKDISLLDIRNKLVHGNLVGDKYFNAIWCATNHLRWINERIVLSILGWDIEKSRIHPKSLNHYYPYSDRGLYQLQLTGWNKKRKKSQNPF